MFYSFHIEDWQSSGMTQTNRTDIGVGLVLIRIILAGTEHLGGSLELGMDLEADSRDVF
jgi:hypothetical protein